MEANMFGMSGNLIFWLICLGMLVGGIVKLFFGNRGRGTIVNVIGGAIGALITGAVGSALNLFGPIAFGVMGTSALLFMFNIFMLIDDRFPLEDGIRKE